MKKILKITTIALASAYILFCLTILVFPQIFFYHPSLRPSELKNAHEYDYPAHEVKYVSADGTQLHAWYTAPTGKDKIIVFMHGNSYNIEEFYYKLKSFMLDGYGTFMPEYRGFGGLKGKINQKNLEADALAAIRFLNKHGYKNENIFLYGMSLGSHMAVHTAYELQKEGEFAGIILEVPFDSLVNTAKKRAPYFPFDLLIRDKFDNTKEITALKSPILIMGAERDETVPVELAKNLYEVAPANKKMIIYKNAEHRNLYNYRNDLDILNWIGLNEKGI